jgi:hypothetical protein
MVRDVPTRVHEPCNADEWVRLQAREGNRNEIAA